MYRIIVAAHVATLSLTDRATGAAAHLLTTTAAGPRRARERGQSTAEYALVLLGAAAVALLFLAWAGKTSRISRLFDTVLDSVRAKVS